MKILSIITSRISDDRADSWRIWNMAGILKANGHDVHMIHFVKKSLRKRLPNGEKKQRRYFTSLLPLPYVDPLAHFKIYRTAKTERPDLLYANLFGAAFASIFTKIATKTPLIFDMHGGLVEEYLLSYPHPYRPNHPLVCSIFLIYKFMEFMVLRFSDKIVCVSHEMMNYLHEWKNVPFEKMIYVTNGVDLEILKPGDDRNIESLKRQLGLEDKFIFGYAGSFPKWQGIENLIEAAKNIDDSKVAFVIIGGQIKERDGNILFLPRMPREQLNDYYSIANVLVLPRPNHPATQVAAPTKFAEYVAMGKPVLVTNVGDAADFVRKYNCGIVVENNTVRSLTEGILQYIAKPKNELERMGRNSRRLAESEFDWNKLAGNLVKGIEYR